MKLAWIAAAVVISGCGSNAGSSFAAAHPNLSLRSNFVPVMPDMRNEKKGRVFQYTSVSGGLLEFDYPKSDKQIGEINGFSGGGECADIAYGAAKRDFWVTGSPSTYQLAEFALGGSKPIKTLSIGSGGLPADCAMDPTTGDLAVTLLNTGGVVIFQDASGSGTVVTTPLVEAFFDGYDNYGNLFVDGFNQSGQTSVVEFSKGSHTPVLLTLSNSVGFPGAVQYDGTYITVGDQLAQVIYGYICKGVSCKLKQTVTLSGASDCGQTWIAPPYVFCPDAGNSEGLVFKYPAGGSPVATLGTSSYLLGGFVEVRK